MPCPTSSDRRRPSASQNRCPRRARWSFPSYSPESLSRHSTLGSRNRRQISFPVLPEVTFVVQEGYFAGSVPPEGSFVVRQGCFHVPVPPGGCFVVRQGSFVGPVPPEGALVARRLTLCVPYHRKSLSHSTACRFHRSGLFELVPGFVLGRGPGTKSFKEVSDYRGFIFLRPCPV